MNENYFYLFKQLYNHILIKIILKRFFFFFVILLMYILMQLSKTDKETVMTFLFPKRLLVAVN